MEKNKNVPKLRFPEFSGEWEEKKYCEIIIEGKLGGNYENSESNIGIPVIKMGNIGRGNIVLGKIQYLPENENYNNDDILKEGDLLFNTRNTLELVGKVSIWRCELPLALYNSNLLRMIFNDQIESSNRFMNYSFNSIKIIKQLRAFATGTTSVAAIYGKDLEHLKISFPSITEQTKIATFLTAVDEKLTQLKKKKTLLEQYKKGIMQKLFSQELRFKDDNNQDFPDWQELPLYSIAKKSKAKNKDRIINTVFSNSATQGIVLQTDYFDKEIANSKNIDGYYLVEPNFFVYNPRISSEAVVGAMNQNKTGLTGLVSPLYTVFQFCVEIINLVFMEYYFKSTIWHDYMRMIANYGARDDRMNIKDDEFFNMTIYLPSLPEQQKIATLLSSIDVKINHSSKQIEKMEAWKKGLLQQMFV